MGEIFISASLQVHVQTDKKKKKNTPILQKDTEDNLFQSVCLKGPMINTH